MQGKKGKGAAGWLWEHGEHRAISEKLQARNAMSKPVFERESPRRRLGLSYDEWQRVSHYTAVYAMKEFGPGSHGLLGILVIDYRKPLTTNGSGVDQLDCIKKLAQDDSEFLELRGAIVRELAD